VLLSAILVAACVLLARAAQFTVLEHDVWSARSAAQHEKVMELPAPRGAIYDRTGVPLAASRERYSIAVAPREIPPDVDVAARLRSVTGLSARDVRRALDPDRKWVVLPGRYDEPARDALDDIHGMHFQTVVQRFYPHDRLGAQVLGIVNAEGTALGGIELEFDSLLSGRPGAATVRRDPDGRAMPGMMLRTKEPVPGHDVYLTLDHALQQIADEALRDALASTGAEGGEVLLTDPATGEILAAASYDAGRQARNWSGVTVPYEPGSTLKPFTVATLLDDGAATLEDSLYGEEGRWTVNGRTIADVHAMGWMTLADALRESSNVGIAKSAGRLDAETQYAYLRAFGFGSPAGVAYPSESAGLLRRPAAWSKQSRESLAIGYEISVTPLQMAMAYGALANGGVLMEPRLVREVRARDGRVIRQFDARAVRRVVSADVAEQLRRVLTDVVADGTGSAASLGTLPVAGKTGTARIAVAGRYVPGAYIATFAGFFPADEPELTFIVKLVRPKGQYYGGQTAAPVTRATLEAALAAQREPVAGALPARLADDRDLDLAPPVSHAADSDASVRNPFTFVMDTGVAAPVRPSAGTVVPDVAGLPLRDAVHRLHEAGLRVRVDGSGVTRGTLPAAGASVKAGAIVRLRAGGAP
jgi:cell division protein FtsI (penicillin-binding protein 3)